MNSPESVINLVKNMINLRALIVRYFDDKYYEQSPLARHNDEVIQYLKERLPSTYLIVRDSEIDNNIVIWI